MAQTSESGAVLNGLLIWLGFLAGWTAVSVPLTLMAAPFGLFWLALGAGVLGAGGAWRARARVAAMLLACPAPAPEVVRPSGRDAVLLAAAVLGISGTTAVFIPTSDARLWWAVTVLMAGLALWRGGTATQLAPARWQSQAGPATGAVLLLAAGLMTICLVVLRPDADDAFYLNLPIGIAGAPHGVLQWDTMYGVPEWPLLGSNYRVEALQTLIAALARVTPLSVAMVAHLLLPMIWCLAWAATLGVVGTALFGRRWWVFAILSVLSGLAFAGTLQSWGVHGVSRLFHGKAPLIVIVIPLIYLLVHRADVQQVPLRRSVPLLAGLICVALGLTANAIYIAPLALGLAVFAGWVARGGAQTGRLLTIGAALPALLAGLWLVLFDTPVTVPPDPDRVFGHLGLWNMFPGKVLLGLMVMTLSVAVCLPLVMPRARMLTALVLAALLFVINPVLWPLYDGAVTGGLNFRLWWALPLPLLFAIFLSWGVIRPGRLAWTLPGATALLLGISLSPYGLLGMWETGYGLSAVKRPAGAMAVAARVPALAQGETVLAVEEIAAWIPTVPGHPPQVYVRQIYLDQNITVVAPGVLEPRRVLAEWINGTRTQDPAPVAEALAELCPRILVVSEARMPAAFDRMTGGQAGLIEKIGGYLVLRLPGGCA